LKILQIVGGREGREGGEGGEGGWRIVIPRPEAINFVDGRRQKWSLDTCSSITYAGIKDIIEHCTELCYLELENMSGLTKADMKAIYEQLLKTGKVDYREWDNNISSYREWDNNISSHNGITIYHQYIIKVTQYFKISKCVQSALTLIKKD
jgi:hypothetical protein